MARPAPDHVRLADPAPRRRSKATAWMVARRNAKRMVDVVGAVIGLIGSALPLVVLALLVRRSMGSPVLFRQQRPGQRGRLFTMVKLRTMRDGVEDDEARITPLGRTLRATSLDELPELWNVLRGDMSLVGPRPLLPEYLDLYSPHQARRHEVRPGVTGLAQVHGRNAVDWDARLDLDVTYVDTWTLTGDLRILARTVLAVLRRSGIGADGHTTMPRFTGSRGAE